MNNTPNWKRAVALSLALLVLVPQVATLKKNGWGN
jgi:hypothetical protein